MAGQVCLADEILLVSAHGQGGGIHRHAVQIQGLLAEWLNEPVVLEFKPGGNAVVATQYINSKTSTKPIFMIGLLQYETSVDQVQDIVPITELGVLNPVLYISATQGIQNWAQLVASKKTLSYGVPLGGPTLWLSGLKRHMKNRVEMIEINYKTSAQMQADLLGNHIDMANGSPSVISALASAGKVVPLMVFGPTRISSLPDTPSAKELGISFPEEQFQARTFLWASAATDPKIVSMIREKYAKWVATAQATQILNGLDNTPPTTLFLTQPAEQIKKLMRNMTKKTASE